MGTALMFSKFVTAALAVACISASVLEPSFLQQQMSKKGKEATAPARGGDGSGSDSRFNIGAVKAAGGEGSGSNNRFNIGAVKAVGGEGSGSNNRFRIGSAGKGGAGSGSD